MVNGVNLLFQFLDNFAFIVLAAAGLAIIFGIMGVINLAHGEFIMVGAYATTLANIRYGLPLIVAVPVAMFVTALFGLVVERTIISGAAPNWLWKYVRMGLAGGLGRLAALDAVPGRVAGGLEAAAERLPEQPLVEPLYDRLADSMVATWGLSLILVQGVRIWFGNSLDQVGTPVVPFVGETVSPGEIPVLNLIVTNSEFSYSAYRVSLAVIALGVLAVVYVLFTKTDFGMRARATIQDEDTARALGVDTGRTYMATFAIGSALAGLTGALYAPTITMVPDMGTGFLVESFVAVVVGGPSVVLGTTMAGGFLGAISATVTNLMGSTFYGRIALLLTAIVLIRFLPSGISGFVRTIRERRQEAT